MNYTDIEIGMTGAQFVDVINGNNALTKEQLQTLAGDILLRVLANNVLQIKSENGKLYYTLDNENWISADNNVWGSITGSISNQTDLVNALNNKANSSDLDLTNASVSALDNRVDGLSTTVQNNTQNISNNSTAIGRIQTKQAKQVSSDTIVLLRIGSGGYMQYSTDGVTWTNVQSIAEINWGAIGGEITNQVDLIDMFNSKLNVSRFTEHTSNHDNPHEVTKTQIGLGNVDNTSDLNKPISVAQQEAIDALDQTLDVLDGSKLDKTEEIQNIEYMSLLEWNIAKELGELSDTTIYIVE